MVLKSLKNENMTHDSHCTGSNGSVCVENPLLTGQGDTGGELLNSVAKGMSDCMLFDGVY